MLARNVLIHKVGSIKYHMGIRVQVSKGELRMEMAVVLSNGAGLHARPAALFVQTATRFQSTVTIRSNGKRANAKSILSLLSLGAKQGDEVVILADGPDSNEAVSALVELVRSGLDH